MPHNYLFFLLKDIQTLFIQSLQIVFYHDLLRPFIQQIAFKGLFEVLFRNLPLVGLVEPAQKIRSHELIRVHPSNFLFDPIKDYFFHGDLKLNNSFFILHSLEFSLPFHLLSSCNVFVLKLFILLLFCPLQLKLYYHYNTACFF